MVNFGIQFRGFYKSLAEFYLISYPKRAYAIQELKFLEKLHALFIRLPNFLSNHVRLFLSHLKLCLFLEKRFSENHFPNFLVFVCHYKS